MKPKKHSSLNVTIDPRYFEAVQHVLGKYDLNITLNLLDPTLSKSGLSQVADEWHGRVFLYLPPGWSENERLCDKWKQEVEAGHIREGIVLLESRTETIWFRQIASVSDAIVFLTKMADQKTPPLAALYVGLFIDSFLPAFHSLGWAAQSQKSWGE